MLREEVSPPPALRSVETLTEAKRSLVHWSAAALVIATVVVLAYVAEILFMAFGGLLFSIVLIELAALLRRYVPMAPGWSLAVVTLALMSLAIMSVAFIVPTVYEQSQKLQEAFPVALERLEAWIDQHRWGVRFWNRMPADAPQIPTDQVVAHLSTAILGTFNGLGSLVLVLFLGLLFAIQPQLYFGGFLKLVPPAHRTRTRGVFYQVAWVLKWWLIARMISMVTIGMLTWGGLLLMGVDYALTLAIIAAVFTFIPYFGPILALAPALLAGLAQSNATAAWVFVLYMAIQLLETYLITPLVEYQAASLPPALSIVVQLSLAILTGPIGFIFADPLLAAGMVLVRAFYVEDVLKDENAGEPEPI